MTSTVRPGRQGARTPRGQADANVLAAVEALLDEGEAFTNLPVGRIADRAGVARSSFYFHFPDKTAMLMRLAETATVSLFGAADRWLADPDGDLEGLVATIDEVIVEYRAHAALLGALAEAAAYTPEVAAFWRELVGGTVTSLRDRLEADRRAGLLPQDLECEAAASYLAWGAERAVSQHVAAHPRPGRGDRRLARGIAQSMWALMRPAS